MSENTKAIKQVILVRDLGWKVRNLAWKENRLALRMVRASWKAMLDMMGNFDQVFCGIGSCRLPPTHRGTHLAEVFDGEDFLFEGIEHFSLPVRSRLNGTSSIELFSVADDAALLLAHQTAQNAGIPTALIDEAVDPWFNDSPTYITVAIGPWYAEEIDKITGPGGLIPTDPL